MKKIVIGACLLVSLVVVPGAEAAFAGPVDFGTATAPVTETVTWSNSGGGAVTINSVDLNGSRSNGPFSFTGTSCAGQSGSLAGCSQQIVFDPTTVPPGAYHATYNLTYTKSGVTATDSVDLTGVADGSPDISVDSESSSGVRGSGTVDSVAANTDGRYVAFSSSADDLVPGFLPAPNPNPWDNQEVYLRDRTANTLAPISVTMSGGSSGGAQVFAVSPTGRYVLFTSSSPDLVEQPFPGGDAELFLRDTQTNSTTLVSVNANGTPANGTIFDAAMSNNTNLICFQAQTNNLVPHEKLDLPEVLCKNMTSGKVSRVDAGGGGALPRYGAELAGIDSTGRYVLFTSRSNNILKNDTDKQVDVFLHNRKTGRTRLVNTTSNGTIIPWCAQPAISNDGSRVVFWNEPTNTLWAKNLTTGHAWPLARVQGTGNGIGLSPGGKYVAFDKWNGATVQLYRENLRNGKQLLVSRAVTGRAGNGNSDYPVVAAGGEITFITWTTNLKLVPGDSTSEAMTWAR